MKLLRLLPRFREAYRSLDQFAARENWSREQIESNQLERLNRLWQHAIQHVRYYNELRSQRKLPVSFRSIPEFQQLVPTLAKSTVRCNSRALLSDRAKRGRWHRTGGSTGAPTSCFWEHDAHQEVLRARYRLYAMWGIEPLDRTAFLWGHEHVFSHSLRGSCEWLRQHLCDKLRDRLRLSAYHLGEDDVREHLRRIQSFRPVMLYGFSRAIHVLATEVARSRWQCDSLRLVILTSEVATPGMLDTIERSFGVPIIIEYGASECQLIAGQWPDRTLRVREDVVLLETLPRQDGRFDLVVTALGNASYPLIRYRIGDVTEKPLNVPDSGFAILHNVAGRNDDLLVTCSGRIIHPTLIDAVFEETLGPIRRYRVHQQTDGSLVASVELRRWTPDFRTSFYADRLKSLMEGFPVQVQVVERIRLTAAGKHRTVTSDVQVASSSANY